MALIDGALPRANAVAGGAAKGIKDLARLRLVTGATLILVSLAGLLGADWDIQWHAVIGRDRTFTPPHDLILIGIGLSGILALISTLECEPATYLEMGHPTTPPVAPTAPPTVPVRRDPPANDASRLRTTSVRQDQRKYFVLRFASAGSKGGTLECEPATHFVLRFVSAGSKGGILIETSWSRRQPDLRLYGTDFLGVLRSSLGSYLVGFGAVCSAIAFPLDTYWDSLYGIDVSLWAPFHTMIYMGSLLGVFGVIYLLLSAAHLSEMQHDRRTAFLSYTGMVAVLGILLSKFSTFLTPALSGHHLHLASLTLNLFPLLMALTAVFVCVLAVRLLPWMGAASMVVVVFLLLWLLVSAFVPPMMTLLVQAEHETYLARASRIGLTIIPLLGQTPVLLLALSIDGVVWLGRRGQWALTRLNTWVLVASMVSMFLVAGFTLVQQTGLRAQAAQGGGGGRGGSLVLGFVLSLLLTVPGSLLGEWLGLTISETVQALRR